MEVEPIESTTAEKTIEILRTLFARFGLPKCLFSNSGPQFTSKEFSDFMAANGVQHVRSAPYHPATNGVAEKFVQTLNKLFEQGEETKEVCDKS